jgi:acetylornithine/N-succinyldiaminopimelate aminotransferase
MTKNGTMTSELEATHTVNIANDLATLQAAEAKLMLQTYARNPYVFVSGHDVYLTDAEGNDYLDLLSGIGVTALGYNHPAVTAAITKQAATLMHTSNLFYHRGTTELALRLTETSGMDRVFLCNSGTEAWEAALKLARAHAMRLRKEGRVIGTKILALEHSFHGRTMGSVATTHKVQYREPFAPLTPGVEFIRMNDVEQLRSTFSDEFCAICIEPVQGEGGIHLVSQEFFQAARELCDNTGALLMADEIQCGLGRTGRWFAYQQYGIRPDVTTLAKPIANGLPVGAMLCTEEAARAITPGMHGTTFGGGPLACAAACAVIDIIKHEGMLEHVTEVGTYFKQQLQSLADRHSAIVDVRGLGLMLGLELHSAEDAKAILAAMMERRIILNRTSETVLRFLPPYTLQKKHVDLTVAALDELLQSLPSRLADGTAPQSDASNSSTSQPATGTLAREAVHG